MKRFTLFIFVLILSLNAGVPGLAQDIRISEDSGSFVQARPRAAKQETGPMVVVWMDSREGQEDVYCQFFGHKGFPLPNRSNFKVNQISDDSRQIYPDVCMDSQARSLIVWVDERSGDYRVYGQYFLANGDFLGENFQIGDDVEGAVQTMTAVACNRKGQALIVWSDNRSGSFDIYTQWLDRYMVPIEGNSCINSDTTGNQIFPAVASNSKGETIVAWVDRRSGTFRIYARIYDVYGESTGDFEVSTSNPLDPQTLPAVAIHDNGAFLVCWEADDESGHRSIFSRMFDIQGTPIIDDIMVSERLGLEIHSQVDVAAIPFRRFEVVWQSNRLVDQNIYTRIVSADGSMLEASAMVNEQPGHQTAPCIIGDDYMNRIIAWGDTRNSAFDIYGAWRGPYWPNHLVVGDGFNGMVPISWDPPFGFNDVVSYTIRRSENSGGPFVEVAEIDPSTRLLPNQMLDWVDRDVVNGVTYYYEIQMNAEGNIGEVWPASSTPEAAGHHLQSSWAFTVPIIDGVIEYSEWSDARYIEMQDRQWRNPLGLLVKNDNDMLYIAVIDFSDNRIETANALGILIDNDISGTWDAAPPSDEGVMLITESAVTFAPFYGHYPDALNAQAPINLGGIDNAILADSLTVCYEVAFPLNSTPFMTEPGQTIGASFWIQDPGHYFNNSHYGYTGQWPYGAFWESAETLGRLTLAESADTVKVYDWPMNGRDPARTSWNPHERSVYPPFDYNQVYTYNAWGYGSVSYESGVIYGSFAGTTGPNRTFAMNPDDGDTLWVFNVPGSNAGSSMQAAISDNLVYCGGQSGDGLFALNKNAGTTEWMQPIGGLYTDFPILDGDRIYIAQDSLFCFNKQTGDVIWRYNVPHVTGTPCVGKSGIFVSHRDSIIALNKYSGDFKWKQPGEATISSTNDKKAVYCFYEDKVLARSVSDGAILWSYQSEEIELGYFYRYMAIDDESLCFTVVEDGEGKGRLVVLDKSDGSFRWEFVFTSPYVNAPSIINNVIYIIDYNGTTNRGILYGFRMSNGEIILLDNTENFSGQPIGADGMLMVPVRSGVKIFSNAVISSIPVLSAGQPNQLQLLQNYPNPFNAMTAMHCQIPQKGQLSIEIFDIQGRRIKTLANFEVNPGWHKFSWDATDLASGVYFCRLTFGEQVLVRKLMLLK
ncbi:PQQ-binding-like beta-propeller repeat protein [bacterium]|nr:PQQ-binding-like beta-propeller repeat protein [bacterium]